MPFFRTGAPLARSVRLCGGLTLFTYTAEPGSRSEEALKLLGSWAATLDPAESAQATDQAEVERDTRSA